MDTHSENGRFPAPSLKEGCSNLNQCLEFTVDIVLSCDSGGPARRLKQQLCSALVAAQWRGATALTLPLFWRRSTVSPVFFGWYLRSSRLRSLAALFPTLLYCCLTSVEARWPIRDGDSVGRGRQSEGSTAETARKRPERPWTAARTMEVSS